VEPEHGGDVECYDPHKHHNADLSPALRALDMERRKGEGSVLSRHSEGHREATASPRTTDAMSSNRPRVPTALPSSTDVARASPVVQPWTSGGTRGAAVMRRRYSTGLT
jgi:hypothetical protein